MFVDFHSHILAGVDDGPPDIKTSREMLKLMKNQGVRVAAATPHFYAHKQPLEEFLKTRQRALDELSVAGCDMPVILPAAEVYIERGIHNLDLSGLCYGNTRLILVELPFCPYQSWMLDEVYNLSVRHSLVPVFAHLDRYLLAHGPQAIGEILGFDGALIQVNHNSLFCRATRKQVLGWIRKGVPVVFGSDCHHPKARAPKPDKARAVIKSRLGERWLFEYEEFTLDLIGYQR